MIKIIGLGEGKKETLTLEVYEILNKSKKIYIKSKDMLLKSVQEIIKNKDIVQLDNDNNYNKIIQDEMKYGNIVYATLGNPKDDDLCTSKLINECLRQNVKYQIYCGIGLSKKNNKSIYELIELINVLRGENGCPWDKEQTHESIKNALIEESYEVIEAIDNKDKDNLIEELGDLLFQIAFHVSLEEGNFTIGDVIDGVYNKMIYRHPHVFGTTKVKNTNEVLINWDELKKKEKNSETYTDEMRRVAKALPALMRASKVQTKAKKVGFDWDNAEQAFYKVIEELNEIKEVYNTKNESKIMEEVGDLLFSCVNVARLLNINSEDALNNTTQKFINRFEYIELEAQKKNKQIQRLTLEEMNELWNKAKKIEK